jgi:hypothetical protein
MSLLTSMLIGTEHVISQLAGNLESISLLVVHPVFSNQALILINMSLSFPLTALTSIYLK